MKLAFSTLGCPDWNLQQVAEYAGEYGFDGVELRIKGDRHIDPSLSSAERQEAKRWFSSRNVNVACLSGYTVFTGKTREEVEANLKTLQLNAQLAYDMGSPLVRTFLGKVQEGMPFDNAVSQVAECLVRASEIVSSLGITLVMETHDHFSSSESVERVLREAGNPARIAVLWDTVHTYHCGETPQQVTERFGSLIQHTHFKDAVPAEDDGKGHNYRYVLAGEGYIPILDNIEALRKIGYDGYLSLEWEKMWHPDLQEPSVALPQYLEYMRKLLASK